MPVTVAIDGPAGAGKSTVSKRVAQALGYTLVDTGAIYRAVALTAERKGVLLDDDPALARIVATLEIGFRFVDSTNRVFLVGEDVSDAIRTPAISMAASTVSARKVVRDGLLALQRRLAGQGGAVLEGRDIGTVVCPMAQVKVYLDASPEERARRRWRELQAKGDATAYESVLADVQRRDAQDMGREHAPLRPATDAVVLDSTALSVDEVIRRILDLVRAQA